MTFELLKNRFGKQVFSNKTPSVRMALDTAYADMSRRQNGHTPEVKDACIDYLVEIFSTPLQIDDFDEWHRALSMELIDRWNRVVADFGTVGRAQKVLNMAFKYLSCIPNNHIAVLPLCHMTLDSYTLEWYEKVVKPWAKAQGRKVGRKVSAWSKINSYDDEYLPIQHNIRAYLAAGSTYSIHIGGTPTAPIPLPVVPVDAEFIIWEGQIIEKRYNDFIKLLENYAKENSETLHKQGYDTWLIGTMFEDYLKKYLTHF